MTCSILFKPFNLNKYPNFRRLQNGPAFQSGTASEQLFPFFLSSCLLQKRSGEKRKIETAVLYTKTAGYSPAAPNGMPPETNPLSG